MSLASEPLPTDPDDLRLFAAGLQAELARKEIEIAANALEIHAKALHIEKLKAQLAVLRRARFGRSSEKLDRDIEQLELLIGDLEEDAAGAEAKQSHAPGAPKTPANPSRHPVRRPLPDHLPRRCDVLVPSYSVPECSRFMPPEITYIEPDHHILRKTPFRAV
jgi:transposase